MTKALAGEQRIYDVIVVGSGLSGWLLLEAFARYDAFKMLDVLMIGDGKEQQRSWCFWDGALPDPFAQMVHSSWPALTYASPEVQTTQTLTHYQYHYIPGASFFQYFQQQFLPAHPNISILDTPAEGITAQQGLFAVHTTGATHYARQVYNSALMGSKPSIDLWQHFRGWFIRTEQPVFDPGKAVLMDFRVPQQLGCSFMYVLPSSATEALVELTFFSGQTFSHEVYDAQLRQYMEQHLTKEYTILEAEQGRIPMQQGVFSHHGPAGAIQIGTLAGMVKPSTGYAFQRIRKDSNLLAQAYFTHAPIRRVRDRGRFAFYDALLLWIIRHHPQACAHIFTRLFSRRKMDLILRFMDQETNLVEEIGIFMRLPLGIFLKALWHYVFSGGKPALPVPARPISHMQHA